MSGEPDDRLQDNPVNDATPGQEIQRLVDTAGEDGDADGKLGRRNTVRFRAGMQLDVSTDPDNPGSTWPVTMHDISDGGFSFWSKRQVRREGHILVREFSADNSTPWLSAKVTHCTVGIRGYLVGAEFCGETSDEPSEARSST